MHWGDQVQWPAVQSEAPQHSMLREQAEVAERQEVESQVPADVQSPGPQQSEELVQVSPLAAHVRVDTPPHTPPVHNEAPQHSMLREQVCPSLRHEFAPQVPPVQSPGPQHWVELVHDSPDTLHVCVVGAVQTPPVHSDDPQHSMLRMQVWPSLRQEFALQVLLAQVPGPQQSNDDVQLSPEIPHCLVPVSAGASLAVSLGLLSVGGLSAAAS